MLLALILFCITYILMISLPKYRYIIAVGAAVVFVVLGIMPLSGVVSAINWNVLMMLTGTMGTVSLFIDSKMPNRLADWLQNLSPNVMWTAVILSLFAGVVSAFIDNVATVLMIAPVGLALAKKLGISPIPMLICISVSSNLQGAATLVGDTTSILLGGYANMDFLDFFFMDGRFSIFWAVELGAIVTVPVIMYIFRKNKEDVDTVELTKVTNMFPTVLLLGTIGLLISASFIPNKPELTNGFICIGICLIGFIHAALTGRKESIKTALSELDYQTLLLLAGLFVVIAGLTEAGVINEISKLFVRIGGSNLFLMYTLLVWGSVIVSAFVDNIPYVATMLPVVASIANTMGCDPTVLFFGLLVGATLGGNITPIGASANIAIIGILRREGYEVQNKDFFQIGIPFTLAAVLSGYLFCWFVWSGI